MPSARAKAISPGWPAERAPPTTSSIEATADAPASTTASLAVNRNDKPGSIAIASTPARRTDCLPAAYAARASSKRGSPTSGFPLIHIGVSTDFKCRGRHSREAARAPPLGGASRQTGSAGEFEHRVRAGGHAGGDSAVCKLGFAHVPGSPRARRPASGAHANAAWASPSPARARRETRSRRSLSEPDDHRPPARLGGEANGRGSGRQRPPPNDSREFPRAGGCGYPWSAR